MEEGGGAGRDLVRGVVVAVVGLDGVSVEFVHGR